MKSCLHLLGLLPMCPVLFGTLYPLGRYYDTYFIDKKLSLAKFEQLAQPK